jgi:hypothetical protein
LRHRRSDKRGGFEQVAPRRQWDPRADEDGQDAGLIERYGVVAMMPSRSGVMSLDRTEKPFSRPMSNALAGSRLVRREVAQAFGNLTDRQCRRPKFGRGNCQIGGA